MASYDPFASLIRDFFATSSATLLKHISSNWARVFLNFGVVFILTPFLLDTLGVAGSGVWDIINSTAGFLILLLLGVPMASVKFFSEHVARKDPEGLNRAIASSFGLYLLLGSLALVASLPLFGFYEWTQNVPADWAVQGRWGFFLVALWVAFGFVAQLPYGVMIAHHDFGLSNAIMGGGLIARLGLTIALLSRWPTLPMLAAIHLAVLAAEYLVAITFVRRRYPDVRFGLAGFDRDMVRRMFSFSFFVLLLNMGFRLNFSTGSLVVGGSRTPEEVAYFSRGLMLMIYLTEVVIAIGQVVMPTATKLRATGADSDLRSIYLKWSKIALSLVLAPSLYLLVLGPEFLVWWTDKPEFYEPAGLTLRIVAIAFLLYLPVRGVALPLLLGLGKSSRPAVVLVVTGTLGILVALGLVRPLGVAGPALGVALSCVLFASYVLHIAGKELGVSPVSWLRHVGAKCAVGALPVLAFLLVAKFNFARLTASLAGIIDGSRRQSFAVLVTAGIGMLVIFAGIWLFFVYRDDPHVDVRKRLNAAFVQIRKRFAGGTP